MPGHLARGHRAGDRYRLEAELGRGSACTVWRATDETLERQVALRFYDPALERTMLVERAGIAASLTHPRVVRIFDTGFDGGQFFTVCELLPGSLAWARLPLPAEDALRTAEQVAEALAYAHQRGVPHGALHAGNVLLGEQGAKVADFAIASSVVDGPPRATKDDLVRLGDLLYLMLTGRERGAAAAQQSRPLPDEPKGLARVVLAMQDGTYTDARRAQTDIQELLPAPAPPSRRRVLPFAIAAAAALIVLAALGATQLGSRLQPSPSPTLPPRITGKPFTVISREDFDPRETGGDGRENANTLRRVDDGNPATFWATERYSTGPGFARKPGVGLILRIAPGRDVGKARVLLAAPGCSFEMRYSQTRPDDVEQWILGGRASRAGTTTVFDIRPAQRARYWLLWITGLTRGVPGREGWACGVAEVGLYPP